MESTNEESQTGCTQTAVAKPNMFREFFGNFGTKKFWYDLTVVVLCEAANACLSALKEAVVLYVRKRRSTSESEAIRGMILGQTNSSPPTSSPSSAFSGGYAPQPTYRPNYSSQSPTPPPPSYPGFGPS